MSLARDFKKRVITEQRESGETAGDQRFKNGEGKEKAVRAAAFKMDLARLKALNSIAQKVEFKKQLIGKYAEECQRYIDTGKGQHPVFIHSMIWMFDTGSLDNGLAYADIAIERGLQMPERFSRDIQTFVADAVLEAMEHGNENQSAHDTVLQRITDGTWQVHEAIQCKYFKRLGGIAFDASDWQAALDWYSKADKVYDGAKVKTRLTELEKKLGK